MADSPHSELFDRVRFFLPNNFNDAAVALREIEEQLQTAERERAGAYDRARAAEVVREKWEARAKRAEEQLQSAEAMCHDIVKRNPPSAFIDTWATMNKAQEFLASFPATEPHDV